MNATIDELTATINRLRTYRVAGRPQPDLEIVIADYERQRARIIILEDEDRMHNPDSECVCPLGHEDCETCS